jgi:predicted small metal-binding protein
MEACPGKLVAETEDEVWELMGLHAKIAHGEDANKWDDETVTYLKTLIKTV